MESKTRQVHTIPTNYPTHKSSRINPHSKTPLNYIKLIKNIKLQQDLRKIRQFRALQQSVKRDKIQVSEIEIELQRVQKQIISKKQQIIKKQMQKIEQNKKQRQQFISFTNRQLNKAKSSQQRKDINMQLSLKQQEEKKKQTYSNTLKQRVIKYRNPINFQEINHHQKKYLQMRQSFIHQNEKLTRNHVRKSLRVRSQAQYHHENQFQTQSIQQKSMVNERIKEQYDEIKNKDQKKREQLVKMIQKRNQYGNRVEVQMKNNKVKTQPHQDYRRVKLSSISSLKQSTSIQRKPQLNTNIPKMSLSDHIHMSLRRIQQNKMTNAMQKIQKLKKIETLYNNNKSFEQDDLLTQLTLIKADLFLHI